MSRSQRSNDKLPLGTFESVWRAAAACRGMDPREFFLGRGVSVPRYIVKLCDGCVAQDCCREYGRVNDLTGVWGGTNSNHNRRNKR